MCERVEFYTNVVKLRPLQIQKALQKEFPDHEIYLSEIYKVTKKFYTKKRRDISNDAASLYEDLLRRKDEDLRWVIKYLRMLYSSKNAWACAYTAKIFTAGIQTTSRVESYNAQIKRLVLNSNISLLELAEALEANINEERNKSKYIYWKTQIPLTSTVITLPQALFPEIDKALSRFLTPAILKVQRIEIKSCLNYQAFAITKAELTKYQDSFLFEPESDAIQFIEDDEDVMQ
ncbi:5341_t:CDS:2, partial [Gigaspora rosea]